YRRTIAMIAGVCTAALWLTTPFLSGLYWPLALTLAMLIQLSGSVAAAVRANRQVKDFSTPQLLIRTASLAPGHRRLPRGWMAQPAPLAVDRSNGRRTDDPYTPGVDAARDCSRRNERCACRFRISHAVSLA